MFQLPPLFRIASEAKFQKQMHDKQGELSELMEEGKEDGENGQSREAPT